MKKSELLIDPHQGAIQSPSGCVGTNCEGWCFFQCPDSEGNTWCILCGNPGAANIDTKLIDRTEQPYFQTTIDCESVNGSPKPAVKLTDTLDTVTGSPQSTDNVHGSPKLLSVTVSPNDDAGSTAKDFRFSNQQHFVIVDQSKEQCYK